MVKEIDIHQKLPVFKNSVACIGYFDGVHRGHQQLIQTAVENSLSAHTEASVICFEPDPIQIITGEIPSHILSYAQRIGKLQEPVMLSDMEKCFFDALEDTDSSAPGRIDVATGHAAFPLISRLAAAFCAKFPRREIKVHRITNEFFGSSVTVSGLITGTDYARQLKGKVGGVLLISRSSLNADGTAFLDDMTPEELEKTLGTRLYANDPDGYALCASFAADYTEN